MKYIPLEELQDVIDLEANKPGTELCCIRIPSSIYDKIHNKGFSGTFLFFDGKRSNNRLISEKLEKAYKENNKRIILKRAGIRAHKGQEVIMLKAPIKTSKENKVCVVINIEKATIKE